MVYGKTVSRASTSTFTYTPSLHNVNMGSSNTKVQCLLRPGQSGKTRKMVELIKEVRANLAELAKAGWSDAGMLNIFVVSNVMALADQTTQRMQKELNDDASSTHSDDSDDGDADAEVIDDCFAWTSGNMGNKFTVDVLFSLIVRKKVSTVVLCANKRRLVFLKNLIGMLNDFAACRDKIHMWIDEADASIKLWSKPDMDVTTLSIVQKVTLVSATFNSILKQYGRLRILGDIITHPPCYHKVADCVVIEDNCAYLPVMGGSNALAYLSSVLPRHPEMCLPGARVFAPGDYTQESHGEIAAYLVAAGFAVLVLNGTEKAIRRPNGLPPLVLDFKPATASEMSGRTPPRPDAALAGEELGVYVARLYHAKGLVQFPFAVTGHLCVGRGLTFQNENFLFNFGIVPHIADDAMAYQAACRMAGNIRGLLGYAPATLVTTTKMWDVIRRQEGFAVNLARLVKERNLEDVGIEEFEEAGGVVDMSNPRRDISRQHKANVVVEEFPSMDALTARWMGISASLPMCRSDGKPRVPHKDVATDKFKCSLGDVSAVQTSTDVRAFASRSTVGWGAGLTNAGAGEIIKRVYVGYDGDVPRFFLRWTYAMPEPMAGVTARQFFAPRA